MTSQTIKGYNEYNLQTIQLLSEFKSHLKASSKTLITIKNYLSDIRHFLGWVISNEAQTDEQEPNLINHFTPTTPSEYKNYLIANETPVSTINRRFTTVRLFLYWMYKQNLINQDLSVDLSNIYPDRPVKKASTKEIIASLMSEYEETIDENLKQTTATDLADFFEFIDENKA